MDCLGICSERGLETLVIQTATELRRAGIACDTQYIGKPQKRFDRLKRDGSDVIIHITTETECTVWYACTGERRHGTIRQAVDHWLWLEDETGLVPEPDTPFLIARPTDDPPAPR